MSARTLPCPACGESVLGGYTLASGRGVLLNPPLDYLEGFGGSAFALHDHGLVTPTSGIGRTEHRCEGGFDVVIAVLRGQATVRPVDSRVERVAKKALAGRLAGPESALPVVLQRLDAAGLTVHHTPTTSGG